MNKWLNRTANLVLLLLCAESLLALIQDSFRLTVRPETYGWLALLCASLWAAIFFRRGFLPGISAAAGVWWFLLHYSEDDLRLGLLDFLRTVRSSWFSAFPNDNAGAAFHVSAGNHSLILLLLLFLAAAYLASVLSGENFRVTLSLLLSLPLVALCLAVNRDPPVLPLLGMGLFWLGLLIGGDTCRPNDAAGRAVLLTLLPCLAVLGLTLLFNDPSSYMAEERALVRSRRIEQLSGALSSIRDRASGIPQVIRGIGRRSDALSGWGQRQDGIDLTQPYDFSARSNEIFTFRCSSDGTLYLRGRSLGSYTGTGWGEAEEQIGTQALNYAAYSVAAAGYTGVGTVMTGSFEIEADRAYDSLYLPYFAISEASGDISVPADGKTAYNGQYLLLTGGSFGPLPDALQQEELQYRSFVKEYYTRLPESTREALAEIARLNGLIAADKEILSKVAEYVCTGSIYDLDVRPYPADDYALYFLQSARRGYCIHYATAACCLYRALGLPARVCEGFLVTVRSGGETVVRAADAHAWVEVWLDGVGWVPVEVTFGDSPAESDAAGSPLFESETGRAEGAAGQNPLPGNRESGSALDRTEAAPGQYASDEASGAEYAGDGGAVDSENSVAPTSPQASPPDLQNARPSEKENREGSNTPPGKESSARTDRIALPTLALLAAVLLAAAAAGKYALLRKRLLRWLTESDGRRRAVYLYRQAQRVLRYGGEMPEAILTAAEKASFSPHTISEEELRRSQEALNALTNQVQSNLGSLRRLIFRYRLGL